MYLNEMHQRRSVLLLADDAGRHDSRVLVNNTIITTCTYSSACQLRAELKWPMLINLECICTARRRLLENLHFLPGSQGAAPRAPREIPSRGMLNKFYSCFFRLTSGAQIKSSPRKNRAPSRMLKWRLGIRWEPAIFFRDSLVHALLEFFASETCQLRRNCSMKIFSQLEPDQVVSHSYDKSCVGRWFNKGSGWNSWLMTASNCGRCLIPVAIK